jgi:hypothetical protein
MHGNRRHFKIVHLTTMVHILPISTIRALEKRCQNRGQYCDRLAIRCCGGSYCTYIAAGGIRYCNKYGYDNGLGSRVAGDGEVEEDEVDEGDE